MIWITFSLCFLFIYDASCLNTWFIGMNERSHLVVEIIRNATVYNDDLVGFTYMFTKNEKLSLQCNADTDKVNLRWRYEEDPDIEIKTNNITNGITLLMNLTARFVMSHITCEAFNPATNIGLQKAKLNFLSRGELMWITGLKRDRYNETVVKKKENSHLTPDETIYSYKFIENEVLNINCITNSAHHDLKWEKNNIIGKEIKKTPGTLRNIHFKANLTSFVHGTNMTCILYDKNRAAAPLQKATIIFKIATGSPPKTDSNQPFVSGFNDKTRLLFLTVNTNNTSYAFNTYYYYYVDNEQINITCMTKNSNKYYVTWEGLKRYDSHSNAKVYKENIKFDVSSLLGNYDQMKLRCESHNIETGDTLAKAIIIFSKMTDPAEDKICGRLVESFHITGLQLNYTKVKNNIKKDVSCEATYEYHDKEILELACMKKLLEFEKNYQRMKFSFRELSKSVNLDESRKKAKYYHINRTFELQSDDNGKKIVCKVISKNTQDLSKQESLVIKLLRKPPEPPTPNEPNIDQNATHLNRQITKRDVSPSKDQSRIKANNITFQLKFPDNKAMCEDNTDGNIMDITEEKGYFINIVVKSCYEIKYGDCNISRWSDGTIGSLIAKIKFNDLQNQAYKTSYGKMCGSNGHVYTVTENIEVRTSGKLNCSFFTHARKPAIISPEENINGITYVRSVCMVDFEVYETASNPDITSTPKINESDIQSQSESTITQEEDIISTENPFSSQPNDKPGPEDKIVEEPNSEVAGVWYWVGGISVICVGLLLLIVYMLKRHVKEDNEPMINSSVCQENQYTSQFPPNLETHYARPFDRTYESTYCEPVKEEDLGKVYSQPVPKSQRNQMKKIMNSRTGNNDVSGNRYTKTEPKNQRAQNNPRSEYEDIDCNRNGYTEYSEIAHGTVSPKYSNMFDGSKYVNVKTDSDYAEPTYYAKI